MWKKIVVKNPIWFFDATGNITKHIIGQNNPFYYSIVCHDEDLSQIIEIFSFVTTCQNVQSVSKYLKYLSYTYELNKIRTSPLIVVDFSWVLINSIMDTFNKCSIGQYLEWSFRSLLPKEAEFLVNLFNGSVFIRLYLCSFHFLKSMRKKLKNIEKQFDKRSVNAFMYCFTLLKNCISLQQFENYLMNIYNLFNNKYFDSTVKRSRDLIRTELQNRNLHRINVIDNEHDMQIKSDINLKDLFKEVLLLPSDDEKTLKANSPFSKYFKKKINFFKTNIELQNIKLEENVKDLVANVYYGPDLFQLIENQLYILPLWTGLMIQKPEVGIFIDRTRITNNPVERWFGILKNSILDKKKNSSISSVSSLIYQYLKSKHFSHYFNNQEKIKIIEKN